jgi:hypothetical protein
MRGNSHVRFGGRPGETDPDQSGHAAPGRPNCTAPAYHSEAHHAVADWTDGGQTNITDLTLACGPDNRRVKRGGWRTRKRKDGRTEWIPPPQLDTGQARVNNFHHPERYLIPDDGDTNDDADEVDEIDDG